MPALYLLKYWKAGLMALMMIAIFILWGLFSHERSLVQADDAAVTSWKSANKICEDNNRKCSTDVDLCNGAVDDLQKRAAAQQSTLDQKDAEIQKREDQLNHELVRARNIPSGCEEGGEWFIEQVATP